MPFIYVTLRYVTCVGSIIKNLRIINTSNARTNVVSINFEHKVEFGRRDHWIGQVETRQDKTRQDNFDLYGSRNKN